MTARVQWSLVVGDLARVHDDQLFSTTELGAVRRYNATVRRSPGLIVDLYRVCEGGVLAARPTRTTGHRWMDGVQ